MVNRDSKLLVSSTPLCSGSCVCMRACVRACVCACVCETLATLEACHVGTSTADYSTTDYNTLYTVIGSAYCV